MSSFSAKSVTKLNPVIDFPKVRKNKVVMEKVELTEITFKDEKGNWLSVKTANGFVVSVEHNGLALPLAS